MKPSDFILNSDYLTIAQVSSTQPYTVYYPSRVFPTVGNTMKPFHVDYEIVSPATPGAIDYFYITYNGINYHASQIYSPPEFNLQPPYEQGQYWVLNVYRKDAKTIVARCDFVPPSVATSVPSTPSLTFTISASSFKPPNVF